MNTGQLALAAWITLLGAITLIGAGLPPQTGIALPADSTHQGASTLEGLVEGATTSADRVTVSLSPVVHDTDRLLVIAAPERSPYPGEARALDGFMDRGGTAVLFVASDAWNDVLVDHGVRLNGALLLSTGDGASARSFPVDLPEELGGGRLVLVNATAISDPGPEVDTVVSQQELVLDLDGDGEVTLGKDEARRFPVVASTSVGEGRLIVIPSGETVLGGQITRSQDALSQLFQAQGSQKRGIVDASTHPMGIVDAMRGPSSALTGLVHASPWAAGATLVLTGLAVALASRASTGARRTQSRLDEQTQATKEWSRGTP